MTLALIPYLLVCAGLLFHAWMAYSVAGVFSGYAGSFYWFTVPHLVLLPLATFLVALDAFWRKRWTLRASLAAIASLLLTWVFAAARWPGGDDGPGIAWAYGVGLAALLSTGLGLPLVYVAHRLSRAHSDRCR